MTRDKKILMSVSVIIFLILLFTLLIPYSLIRVIASIILVICAYLTHILIKKRSILSINKRQVLCIMLVVGLLYVSLFALSGISFGYYLSLNVINYDTITKEIIPSIIIITSVEIIRRILLAQDNRFVTIISYFIGVFSEIIIFTNIASIKTFGIFMDLMGMVLLPSITANILYTHVSKNYGSLPNIIFRVILSLYAYFLPFDVGTPESLIAVVKVMLPLMVYYFIYALYTNKNRQKVQKKNLFFYIIPCTVFLIMIFMAMIISCKFRYGLLVIGSESMAGELNKGDAIIYEQYNNQDIQEGQIIVFNKDNMQVIHRVVEIKNINGQKLYFTKGDANEDLDVGYIVDNDIIGVLKFKILYIGYPSLWMREIFV